MSKVRLAGSVNFAHAIPVIYNGYNPHMPSLWSLSDEMSEPDSEPELVSLPRRSKRLTGRTGQNHPQEVASSATTCHRGACEVVSQLHGLKQHMGVKRSLEGRSSLACTLFRECPQAARASSFLLNRGWRSEERQLIKRNMHLRQAQRPEIVVGASVVLITRHDLRHNLHRLRANMARERARSSRWPAWKGARSAMTM